MKLKINEYKQLILDKVTEAGAKKWIDKEAIESIQSSLNTDNLIIGFVGKMNMGKSSIINALIFGDNVLPTSPTPMTVTLTSIKYGEQESATVTIITAEDFDEICRIKDVSDNSEPEEKVNSAKDLYDAIVKIDNYKNLLGKTKMIDLQEYEDYIGSEGKLSALAKSVIITLPKKELQDVTIVDTPGFNDPISSRDDDTFNFLSQANVIVLVPDPYNTFDVTDMYLLESQISKAGIGKMVVAINKFDTLGNVSWDDELNKRITKRNGIVTETENDIIKELLKDCKIIPISSIMALVGHLKRQGAEVLANNPQIAFFYGKLQQKFPELQTTDDYIKKSNISILETEVNKIVGEQKSVLLLDAPLKKITEMLTAILQAKENDVKNYTEDIKVLKEGIPDVEEQKREFRNFIEILFDRFSTSTIQNTLLDSIKSVLNELQTKRSELLSKITNESYPDPGLFGGQQKKMNHENIQRLYWDMDSSIRLTLNINLNGTIESQVEEEINNIIAYLTGNLPLNMKNIHRKILEKLKNELRKALQKIIVNVNTIIPDVPANSTFWKQTAAMYYKNIFNQSYSDGCLIQFFKKFREYAEQQVRTDLEDCADKLGRNQQRVFDAANDENKSRQEIAEIETEVKTLNTEITEIKGILNELNSITINTE